MATPQRPTRHTTGQLHSDFGTGKGPGCPQFNCCDDLKAELGAAGPGVSLFDMINSIINNKLIDLDINIDTDSTDTLPERTLFVSPSWSNPVDPDRQFTSFEAAFAAAAALNPTIDAPVVIIVYTGDYPSITVPGNVTIRGQGDVRIAGVTYEPVENGGDQDAKLYDLIIGGPVAVDTTGLTSASTGSILFSRSIIGAFPFTATLRTSAGATAIDGYDAITFREGVLGASSVAVNVAGGLLTSAQFAILNSRVSVSGVFNVIGSAAVVPFLRKLKPVDATKALAQPSKPQARAAKVVSRSKAKRRGFARPLVPVGPVTNGIFFEASSVDVFEVGTLNITDANTLVEDVCFAPFAEEASINVAGGVFNSSHCTYMPDVTVQLSGENVSSFMNSGYDIAQLTAIDTAAADRDLNIGSVAAAATSLAGTFGAVVTHDVPYVNAYAITGVASAAAIVGTPIVPLVVASTPTGAELALSSTAMAATTIEYTIVQQTAPQPYV